MATQTKRGIVKELLRAARRNYPRRKVILKGLNDLWQIDLIDYIKYSSENRGYKYILVAIDCFSKFVWLQPLKNKSAECTSRAMERILAEAQAHPKNIQSDDGKEFFNTKFSHLMHQFGINHYSSFSKLKACIVERFIRTVKSKIYELFLLRGKYEWYDSIEKIARGYNNTKHRTIGMKPRDLIGNKNAEKMLLKTVYLNKKMVSPHKYLVGDFVRVSKAKTLFEKGYTANWSTELFKISKIHYTQPITYLLEDLDGRPIQGGFYEAEIYPTKYRDSYLVEKILKRRGNKLLVRWLNFGREHDSWIMDKDVL